MLYTGFNENEMQKITSILNNFGVEFRVSIYEDSVNAIKESMGYDLRHLRGGTLDVSLLQIEIDEKEFKKIDPVTAKQLEELRIYQEIDSPFQDKIFGEAERPLQLMYRSQKHEFEKNLFLYMILTTMLGLVGLVAWWLTR